MMGGTTTSWSTDGAAKVGEGQVETAPGARLPEGAEAGSHQQRLIHS